MLNKIRDWYILAIALLAMTLGFYAISSESKPTSTAAAPPPAQQEAREQKVAGTQAPAPERRPEQNQSPSPAVAASPGGGPAPMPAAAAPVPVQHVGHGAPPPTQMASAGAPTSSTPPAPNAPAPNAAAQSVEGDPASGRQTYQKCQACHSLEPGKNMLGPSLAGILGKKAGTVPNYNYSAALKSSNLVWDIPTLNAYLENPQKVVPGNKMPFAGLRTENERKNVIAYMVGGRALAAQPTAGAQPAPGSQQTAGQPGQPAQTAQAAPPGAPAGASPGSTSAEVPPARDANALPQSSTAYMAEARYTLRSGIAEGRMVFLGVGGAIDGQVNPMLTAAEGQVVQITLINGEGAEHDIVFPEQDARSPRVTGRGSSTSLVFRARKVGDFTYICSVPGHDLAGMRGQFIVTPKPPENTVVEADISQRANEVPAPIGNRPPQTVRVDLVTVEVEARLAEGTTFGYWTFNGRVPGPMLRVRVGDTVEVSVTNAENSSMVHSVDFHAATGPGGGAAATQVDPGDSKSFKFKALSPGLFVYHCATPMVAHHIANGMYGLILVEPEGGLPPVDREFYVMQGEVYTEAPFGQHGSQNFSVEKLLNEKPEYFVFNGAVGALSKLHPLEAKVGETVRIFFGVGGPNYSSSFHVIGEIFDRAYPFADLMSPPLRGVQTITVPAGGAAMAEFKLDVPGNYVLVDHALSRAERGLVGILHVEGQPNHEIFEGKIEPGMGH